MDLCLTHDDSAFFCVKFWQVDRQPDVLEVMMAHACHVRGPAGRVC